MPMKTIPVCLTLLFPLVPAGIASAGTPEGVSFITSRGYSGCVLLENSEVRVVLEPNMGGRVIEYSLKGKNAIQTDPAQDGWVYRPGAPAIEPSGGRCDIGPEEIIASHPDLWLGTWKAEITGARSARLTSVADTATGFQLVRDFRLDRKTSRLKFTQTIKNVSGETKVSFHWGRTFAEGNGICVIPLTPDSRFPKGYILYGPGPVINYRPAPHPNVSVRDGFFIVTGEPALPQYGFDTFAGWFAYLTRSSLLFVKKFPVYPDRPYGEIPAPTVVIWYYKDRMCELEPIGPRETIRPGKSASFTEEWWLLPHDYPSDGRVDPKAVEALAKANTR